MTRILRVLPGLLLLAGPAAAQSSLGQQNNLPPPRPPGATAPAPGPAPQATAPAAKPSQPAASRAAQPQAAKPAQPAAAKPTPVVQPKPGATAQPKPATASAPKPGQTGAQQAKPAQPPRRPPPAAAAGAGAAAGAAGAAAGAAATTAARPPEPPAPPAQRVGSATNLPLPRYAALGSNQVNLRIGPDLRYRIEWTYQRRDLPVQIIDEHQIWRRIRDPEGTEGWVQRPLLSSKRTFLVQGDERALRRRPDDGADAVARLKPGVVGTLRSCAAGNAWCEARVGEYRGYLKRSEIWGVAPDEAIND